MYARARARVRGAWVRGQARACVRGAWVRARTRALAGDPSALLHRGSLSPPTADSAQTPAADDRRPGDPSPVRPPPHPLGVLRVRRAVDRQAHRGGRRRRRQPRRRDHRPRHDRLDVGSAVRVRALRHQADPRHRGVHDRPRHPREPGEDPRRRRRGRHRCGRRRRGRHGPGDQDEDLRAPDDPRAHRRGVPEPHPAGEHLAGDEVGRPPAHGLRAPGRARRGPDRPDRVPRRTRRRPPLAHHGGERRARRGRDVARPGECRQAHFRRRSRECLCGSRRPRYSGAGIRAPPPLRFRREERPANRRGERQPLRQEAGTARARRVDRPRPLEAEEGEGDHRLVRGPLPILRPRSPPPHRRGDARRPP